MIPLLPFFAGLSPATLSRLKLLGVVVAAVTLFIAGWTVQGWRAEVKIAKIERDLATAQATAVKAAREEEQRRQEAVNEALRKQNETLARVSSGLQRDLDWLRNRPERPAGVSSGARPGCEGANGVELARDHAGFLARYAALAARYDSALATCYATLDALKPVK